MIIQDDLFDATASVTVAPITSTLVDASLLRVRLMAGGVSGLSSDSDVMIDKLTTVRRGNIKTKLGRLTSSQLVEVERASMTFLGLAS